MLDKLKELISSVKTKLAFLINAAPFIVGVALGVVLHAPIKLVVDSVLAILKLVI